MKKQEYSHPSRLVCSLGFVVTSFALLSAGCSSLVRKPPPQRREPQVTIIAYPVGSGRVDPGVSSTDRTVMVTKGTRVMVLATARSSEGIHHLSLQVLAGGQNGYGVLTVANPDAHGRLPDALYILGSDGHDHVGSIPLIFTMDGSPASTKASSSNSSGTSTTVKLTFSCADCR